MKRIVILFLIMAVGYFAAENLPISPKISDGKTVYFPIDKPVNLYEEKSVQAEDQNSTGHGKAKK